MKQLSKLKYHRGKSFCLSVFSPNGDLTNDVFYPVSNTGDVLDQRMLIMDRWGAAVFDHSNFKSDDPSSGMERYPSRM
ncbi:MAG: gliding motility-associated C-terminal domain-containing protein [Saprospiraceae bacterium]|nr:gliding motility-associated C-terminal domain-containing protein [Candidatus Vicinibacter affinis]